MYFVSCLLHIYYKFKQPNTVDKTICPVKSIQLLRQVQLCVVSITLRALKIARLSTNKPLRVANSMSYCMSNE